MKIYLVAMIMIHMILNSDSKYLLLIFNDNIYRIFVLKNNKVKYQFKMLSVEK